MKFILIFLIIIFSQVKAEEIRIINLHSSDTSEEIDNEKNKTLDELSNKQNIDDEVIIENNEIIIDETTSEENTSYENQENNSVVELPNFWQEVSKEDLLFFFNNLESNKSNILSSLLIDNLLANVESPDYLNQHEYDNLRILTLIKLGHKDKAIDLIKNIATYDYYKKEYDLLLLDYYLTINNLTEACTFKDSFEENELKNNNLVLKMNIFCALLQNKDEEANFLNSLLLDTSENDEYFQKIFYNLKNDINETIDLKNITLSENSIALYSAMLRIGNLPFTEKYLEYDPINLSLPIILSSSTKIELRIKAAHKAYELGLFNSESLSALYKSVDFNNDQLNNSLTTLKNYLDKPELGMSLLFQTANVQLLPITRLESLKHFWNYSAKNNLEKLGFEISKSLIESIEPSIELSEYALPIAKAHISNNNFQEAIKWITFAEKFINNYSEEKIENLKSISFLYDLKTVENQNQFIEIFLSGQIFDKKNNFIDNEILKIIILTTNQKENDKLNLNFNNVVFDKRTMPSSYIIEKIINSSNSGNFAELILSSNISMNGKLWKDVHSYHLKILLESYKKIEFENVFMLLLIEILEDSKII